MKDKAAGGAFYTMAAGLTALALMFCASARAGPCNVSIKPERLARGVFSSWLALATKSARSRSALFAAVRSWRSKSAARPAASDFSSNSVT